MAHENKEAVPLLVIIISRWCLTIKELVTIIIIVILQQAVPWTTKSINLVESVSALPTAHPTAVVATDKTGPHSQPSRGTGTSQPS